MARANCAGPGARGASCSRLNPHPRRKRSAGVPPASSGGVPAAKTKTERIAGRDAPANSQARRLRYLVTGPERQHIRELLLLVISQGLVQCAAHETNAGLALRCSGPVDLPRCLPRPGHPDDDFRQLPRRGESDSGLGEAPAARPGRLHLRRCGVPRLPVHRRRGDSFGAAQAHGSRRIVPEPGWGRLVPSRNDGFAGYGDEPSPPRFSGAKRVKMSGDSLAESPEPPHIPDQSLP